MDANLLWAQVIYTFTAPRRNRRRKSQLLFLRFISRSELPMPPEFLPSLKKVTSHYPGTRLVRRTTLKIIDCEFHNLSNSYQSYHATECMCHMMLLCFFYRGPTAVCFKPWCESFPSWHLEMKETWGPWSTISYHTSTLRSKFLANCGKEVWPVNSFFSLTGRIIFIAPRSDSCTALSPKELLDLQSQFTGSLSGL